MEFLQYLIIGSAILFLISLTWLINLTGNFDCLKNSSQVRSSNHCLQIIVEKSDKILQASKTRNLLYQPIQKTSTTTQVETEVSNTKKSRQLRPYIQKEDLILSVLKNIYHLCIFSQSMGWHIFFYCAASFPVSTLTL